MLSCHMGSGLEWLGFYRTDVDMFVVVFLVLFFPVSIQLEINAPISVCIKLFIILCYDLVIFIFSCHRAFFIF